MTRAMWIALREWRAVVGSRTFVAWQLLGPASAVAFAVAWLHLAIYLTTERLPSMAVPNRYLLVDDATGAGDRIAEVATTPELLIEVVSLDEAKAEVTEGRASGWALLTPAALADGSLAWHGTMPRSTHLPGAIALAIVEQTTGTPPRELAKLHGALVGVPGEPTALARHGTNLGPLFLLGALFLLPKMAMSDVRKEREKGLGDRLVCIAAAGEMLVGRTVGSLAILATKVALWSMVVSVLALGTVATVGVPFGFSGPVPWLALALWGDAVMMNGCGILAVAVAIELGGEGVGKPMTLAVPVALVAMLGVVGGATIAPDGANMYALSLVPTLGAPILYARWLAGLASTPEFVVVTAVSGVATSGFALLVLSLGRAARALGAWPRSLQDLRKAWALR